MVKQGDIIWLDFDPQTGHEQRGRRPALVVSNESFSVVVALFAGFASCKKDSQSSACEIITFKVGDKTWDVVGTNVTATYPKGSNVSSLSPVIEVSEKATVSPKSGVTQDFSNDKAVSYVVTAENGKTKTYTARATVSL